MPAAYSTDHTFREVSDSSIASLTGKQVDTVLCTMCAHYMSMKFPGAFPSKKFSAFHCLCTKREEKKKGMGGKSKATTCFQAKIIYLLLKIYGYLNTILSEDLFFGFNFVLLLVCFYHPSVSIRNKREYFIYTQ